MPGPRHDVHGPAHRAGLACAVLLVLGLVAPANAASRFAGSGPVRSIDTSRRTLTVADSGGDAALRGHDVVVVASRTARVTRDGQPASLAAVRAGDSVGVSGSRDSHGRLVASSIAATSPPQPDTTAAPSEPGACVYYSCTPSLPPTTAGPTLTMTIQDYVFNPPTAVIDPGTIVVVRNADPVPHTFSGNHLSSGPLTAGTGFSVMFVIPGTYRFFCAIHPFMTGVIEVR